MAAVEKGVFSRWALHKHSSMHTRDNEESMGSKQSGTEDIEWHKSLR